MSKVIIDTSVWIEFFRYKNWQHTEKFKKLMTENRVYLLPIIRFEILVGAKSQSEYSKLKDFLDLIEISSFNLFESDKFLKFSRNLRQVGLMGSFSDLVIAYYSYELKFPIWSLDHYFYKLEKKKFVSIF